MLIYLVWQEQPLLWPHLDAYIKSLRNVGKHLIKYHTPPSKLGLHINFLKTLSTLCLWLYLTYHHPSSLYSSVCLSRVTQWRSKKLFNPRRKVQGSATYLKARDNSCKLIQDLLPYRSLLLFIFILF